MADQSDRSVVIAFKVSPFFGMVTIIDVVQLDGHFFPFQINMHHTI